MCQKWHFEFSKISLLWEGEWGTPLVHTLSLMKNPCYAIGLSHSAFTIFFFFFFFFVFFVANIKRKITARKSMTTL